MPELNPYEAPQSELQAPAPASAPCAVVTRSIRILNALQSVLVIAIAICFMIGVEPGKWNWAFLRSLLFGLGLNSTLLALLAVRKSAWVLLALAIAALSMAGLLLYAMTQAEF